MKDIEVIVSYRNDKDDTVFTEKAKKWAVESAFKTYTKVFLIIRNGAIAREEMVFTK